MARPAVDAAAFARRQLGYLPGELGVEMIEVKPGFVKSRLPITKRLLAPNGFLHAASVIALADTSAGYGCVASLPEGARGFTTIELKSNFLGTLTEGAIECEATALHLGKTTQVWDAVVTDGKGKTLALFRCTQMVLR
jgi:uncharacterized protein (TIGR00369 family)